MRHVIITSSDAKYGDFLLNHWLRSLRENVQLNNIDVVVLDYGLNDDQREQLFSSGITIHPSLKDGNITNLRYRDMARFLNENSYDQVLSIDGGDIIFQSDISHLFERDKSQFRGVCEERKVPFHDMILPRTDMTPDNFEKVFGFLEGKPTVNGGVIFGPAVKLKKVWMEFERLCRRYDVFGNDQLVMNYLLYKDGFVKLDIKYNFIILLTRSRFRIQDGLFYNDQGEVIPIVHNAGRRQLTRCIRKFGYGRGRNERKLLTFYALVSFNCMLNGYKHVRYLVTKQKHQA